MAKVQEREESGNISIRIKSRQRDLIDQAARRLRRSRSEFMLDVACREAENVLLDQTFFIIDAAAFDKFQSMLDSPAAPSEGLLRLMRTKAPWE